MLEKKEKTKDSFYMMAVTACYISRPITSSEEQKDRNVLKVLDNLVPVSTNNNKILMAIMDAYGTWEHSPIVWVDNFPYRIKLLEHTSKHAIMLQICLGVYYKSSGKECYYNINRRKVKIEF
jgi:hypothetical protein